MRHASPATQRPRSTGFTLIELLVVIAIIAVLAAILFPVFAAARDSAKKSVCLSNMMQIGLGMQMYANDFEDAWVGAGHWPKKVERYITKKSTLRAAKVFVCPSDINTAAFVGYDISYTLNNMICGTVSIYRNRSNCDTYTEKAIVCEGSDDEIRTLEDATEGAKDNQQTYGRGDTPNRRIEPRHRGGSNYLFGDWHATYLKDPPGGNMPIADISVKSRYWKPDR